MQPDTQLILGPFQFSALEIPDSIRTGGSQQLVTHQLVGGTRVVQSMGRCDDPLEWEGLFFGSTALDRSRGLDAIRIAGTLQRLTWSQYNYLIIVKEFHADNRRRFEIPYRIVCEVVSDLTAPASSVGTPPVDYAIQDDAASALGLAGLIGDGTLLRLMNTLVGSVGVVSSFTHASNSTISTVTQPLLAALAQVTTLTNVANANVMQTSFAGVDGSAGAAAALASQTTNMQQLNNLKQMGNLLGRMGNNLGLINASPQTIATAGDNLFRIATQAYGDPTAWTGIAKANDLTDPYIVGPDVLTIPAEADQSDGILDA